MSHKAENTGGFEACVMSVADLLFIRKRNITLSVFGLICVSLISYGVFIYYSGQKEEDLYNEWAGIQAKIAVEKEKKKPDQDLRKFEAELTQFIPKSASYSLAIFPAVELLDIYDQNKDFQKSNELIQSLLKTKISIEFKQILQLRHCGYLENLKQNALECYREIFSSSSNPKFARVEALFALIRISHLSGKSAEAQGFLDELKKLDAQNPIVKEAEYVLSSRTNP